MRAHGALVVALMHVFVLGACKEKVLRPMAEKARKTEPRKPTAPAPTPAPGQEQERAHPDYPTPAAAGTEKIFYLEEPDRGPGVTPVTLPARGTLSWRQSAHCEPHETGVACSAAAGPSWKLGSRGGKLVLAERFSGGRAQEIYLFERRGASLARITRLDGRHVIAWTRFFDREKPRFSARKLDGGNALPGCGHMAYKPKAGPPEELTCLQWTGKPMRDVDGVRTRRFKRDGRGFVIEETRVTPDGSPMADNDGVHRLRFTRDGEGRVVEVRYLDIEGKPAMSAKSGCHGQRREYDDRGLLRRTTCLGPDGRPATAQSGAHADELRRDARGCVVQKSLVDAEGRPAVNRHGVHAFRQTVDPLCQPLSKTCLGRNGKPVSCGPGQPARHVYTLDRRGFRVSTKHYDASGRPGKDASYKVFEVRVERDEKGNAVGEGCFDTRGRPVECFRTGFHRSASRIDGAGRTIDRRFFDEKGAATTNLGCAVRRFRYDNYDHEYEAVDLDDKGQVIETFNKATLRTLYDQSHRVFAVLLLDKEGRPSRYGGCFTNVDCPGLAWHAVRVVRDAKGAVVKNLYFDAARQLINTMDCRSHRCWH